MEIRKVIKDILKENQGLQPKDLKSSGFPGGSTTWHKKTPSLKTRGRVQGTGPRHLVKGLEEWEGADAPGKRIKIKG